MPGCFAGLILLLGSTGEIPVVEGQLRENVVFRVGARMPVAPTSDPEAIWAPTAVLRMPREKVVVFLFPGD